MVAVGNNWLRTFLVCHHLGRNCELVLGKWEIIRGGGSWRLPWACSCPQPEGEGLGILGEVEHPHGLWLHPWLWDFGWEWCR